MNHFSYLRIILFQSELAICTCCQHTPLPHIEEYMYCIREINLTAISPQISSSTFCVVMCAWCSSTFCSCTHLPSGAWSGKKRKRTSFCQNNLPSSLSPLIEQNFVFVQFVPPLSDAPPGYFVILTKWTYHFNSFFVPTPAVHLVKNVAPFRVSW